jgi:hypothetical protein
MHTVAMFYPDFPTSDDMGHARNFYLSLQGLLPCASCSHHYTQLLVQHPLEPALQSKMELMRWVWTIHDAVNTRIGKHGPTFAEYLASVQRDTGKATAGLDPLIWGIVVAAVLIVLARMLVRRHMS